MIRIAAEVLPIRAVDRFWIAIGKLHAGGVQREGIVGVQRERGIEDAVVIALGPRDGRNGNEHQEEQDGDGATAQARAGSGALGGRADR